jgi:hypothetical protein
MEFPSSQKYINRKSNYVRLVIILLSLPLFLTPISLILIKGKNVQWDLIIIMFFVAGIVEVAFWVIYSLGVLNIRGRRISVEDGDLIFHYPRRMNARFSLKQIRNIIIRIKKEDVSCIDIFTPQAPKGVIAIEGFENMKALADELRKQMPSANILEQVI